MQNNTRRYKIHSELRSVLVINPRKREVMVTDEIISNLDKKSLKLLFELRDTFRYKLQYYIK